MPLAEAKTSVEDLRTAIQLLMKTARGIRKLRFGVGALSLASAEIRVKLGKSRKTVWRL